MFDAEKNDEFYKEVIEDELLASLNHLREKKVQVLMDGRLNYSPTFSNSSKEIYWALWRSRGPQALYIIISSPHISLSFSNTTLQSASLTTRPYNSTISYTKSYQRPLSATCTVLFLAISLFNNMVFFRRGLQMTLLQIHRKACTLSTPNI